MSTEVKCVVGKKDLMRVTTMFGPSEISVQVHEGTKRATVLLRRADFLTAISSELDVVIIDTPDPLTDREAELLEAKGVKNLTAAEARSLGTHYFALAVRIEANPPVDEKQVEALAALFEGSEVKGCQDGWDWNDLARSVLRSRKVEVRL